MNIKKIFYDKVLAARRRLVERTVAATSGLVMRRQREQFQTEQFNRIWKCAYTNVPFYAKWRELYGLPEKIDDLTELENWPVLTKTDLRDRDAFRRLDVPVPNGRILTGGSTGEPVRLPSWGDAFSGVSQIIGRSAYGIEPGDRTFLLWGHEHLYGTGFKRRVNALKRRFKDWLADWKRVSAYDLSAKAMHGAYAEFNKVRPKFVIGFSPAVLAFVRHNKDKAGLVDSVRVILCTAGPLTQDEKREIESFFNGVVCMEYGSVECGIMAYTRPKDGLYDVFWNTHLLQAQKQPNGEYKNIVTRLTDCYVPLIRYDIGDYLDIDPNEELDNVRSVLEFRNVKGRPSEMINFACGVSFFGALIGDCVKQVPEVISSQIAVNEKGNNLVIRVTASTHLQTAKLEIIKNRFLLTVSDAEKLNISVVQCDRLHMTVGGKTPRVIHV